VLGSIPTSGSSFDYNGESDLDLEYAMTLVTKGQNVTLYQVGDSVEGMEMTDWFNIQG
jgi:tripeptidyl-peptidase-1